MRRHPWLTGIGVTSAVLVGSAGYIAPVYPFDYANNTVVDVGPLRIDVPGQSPAINALARRADSKYYKGSVERNRSQVKVIESLPPPVARPNLSISSTAQVATDMSARNTQLTTAPPEQTEKYERILSYFAPVILQDGERMQNPSANVPQAEFFKDIPVSFTFDGDTNVKNNPQNLLAWGTQSENVSALQPTV